jgi:peptidoglycan/LPS O-acetylase OafA/YrhL
MTVPAATSTPPPAPRYLPAHLPSLDGMRGIAIALVLIHQLGGLESGAGIFAYLFRYTIGFGWTGVQLFFVLSGFLITGILLDSQGSPHYFRNFFARRGLRIFPLYFSSLAIAFLILPALGISSALLEQDHPNQIWLWTYLENWAQLFGKGSVAFPHYWSLSVEEQFYLLWPLLLWRRTAEECLRLCLAVALASLLTHCLIAWYGVTSSDIFYYSSVCRADALALGGAAAALLRIEGWRDWIVAQRARILNAAFVIALIGMLTTHGFSVYEVSGEVIGYTIVSLVFAAFVIVAAGDDAERDNGWRRALRWRPLQLLGKYSYAIYIFHKPLHDYLGKPLQVSLSLRMRDSIAHNIIYIAGGAMLLLALAVLSYHLFEKHFLHIKRSFT